MTNTQMRVLRIVRMTVFLAALAGSAVTGFQWARHDFPNWQPGQANQ